MTTLTIDGTHHESYLCGVGRACEVGVNLFCLGLVKGNESVEDVVASSSIIWAT